MKKKYIMYLKVLDYISYVVLFALFSFTIIIILESLKLNLLLTSDGINNFLELYLPSIQLSATWIAIMTLKLTLERLFIQNKQLIKQSKHIKITYNNIQYNNYYSHQREFIHLLKNTLLFRELENPKDKSHHIFLELYYLFFPSNYKIFNGKLIPQVESSMKESFAMIQQTHENLSKSSFDEIDISILEKIFNKYDSKLSKLCEIILEQKLIKVGIYSSDKEDDNYRKKYYLITIYLISDLYLNLLTFSNSTFRLEPSTKSILEKLLLTQNILFNNKEVV